MASVPPYRQGIVEVRVAKVKSLSPVAGIAVNFTAAAPPQRQPRLYPAS